MRPSTRCRAAVCKAAAFACLLAAMIAGPFALSSCSDVAGAPVSVRERMELFIADAEAGDWDGMRAHAHHGAEQYDVADAAFWQAAFGAEDFAGAIPVYSGRVAVVEAATNTYTFDFEANADGDYCIAEITRSSDGSRIFQ